MDKFSKAELADFKRFWEGEVGKKYLKRLEGTKDQLVKVAMGTMDRDQAAYHVAVANGFESLIQDIKATIKNATDEGEKEASAAKKK